MWNRYSTSNNINWDITTNIIKPREEYDIDKVILELCFDWNKPKRKRKLNPKIIRKYDLVRIVQPYRFIRCGYYVNFVESKRFFTSSKSTGREELDAFLKKIGLSDLSAGELNRITSALAFGRTRVRTRDCEKRTVFERAIPILNLSEYIFMVEKVNYCRTGTYFSGGAGCDYYGEYWHEPSYIANPKTHKILTLTPRPSIYGVSDTLRTPQNDFRVLASRVEKVHIDELAEKPAKPKFKFEDYVKNYIQENPIKWDKEVQNRITVGRVQAAGNNFYWK